jgi:hypothetical protein
MFETHYLLQRSTEFFYKGPKSKCFGLLGLCDFCHSFSALPVSSESIHRYLRNGWLAHEPGLRQEGKRGMILSDYDWI